MIQPDLSRPCCSQRPTTDGASRTASSGFGPRQSFRAAMTEGSGLVPNIVSHIGEVIPNQ